MIPLMVFMAFGALEVMMNPFIQFDDAFASHSRRLFLQRMAAFSTGLALPCVLFAEHDKPLFDEPWVTLETVQAHLFPSTSDSPGAKEINALSYLYLIIEDKQFDAEIRQLILNGEKWLNDATQQRHHKKFIALDFTKKEAALQWISKSSVGENWLSTLMSYIIEALLCDPIYANNKALGWHWLEHQPGFPRPSLKQRYMEY